MSNINLTTKLVGEITGDFVIPAYQRGYRWQGEIKMLLDDINEIPDGEKYCLQPIVVKKIIDNKYELIDGQQRLTTLFLLYWFVAKKENVGEADYEFLNHFSYFTRPSSRDFCKNLVKQTPSFDRTISEELKDKSWFQYQWHNDPTIQGMLVMIDAINQKYGSASNLWGQLENVSFYFLPISEMGLTDELYIKMNSRGKPLTEFEHFKAEFEGMIKELDEGMSIEFNRKFDLDWTDLFFPYRGENKIIDDEFMRYFFFISDILCYKKHIPLEKDAFKLAKLLYSKDNPEAKANLVFLKSSFDCWCKFDIDDFFNRIFSNDTYESGKVKIYQENLNVFRQCCNDYNEDNGRNRKFPLNMTLLLYAVVIYLQNKGNVSETDFQRRIRIVRNLIWNSPDEIRADGQRNNMPQLLDETEKIILSGTIPQGIGYNKFQRKEELDKIEWLRTHPNMQDALFHLEDHSLLFGCISVVGLDCSDNFDKFRNLYNIRNRNLISQALLAQGDYSQSIGWRWQLGTKVESTWIDMLHPSNKRNGFEDKTKNTLNNLLSALTTINEESLQAIVNNYLNDEHTKKDWRFYFVKYGDVMLSQTSGMYYTYGDGEYHVLKMRTSERLSGKNWNVFLLALNEQMGHKYPLGDYAYQMDKLKIADNMWLDCLNDKFVMYVRIEEQWVETQVFNIPQNQDGIDIEDRVVWIKRELESLGY